MLDPARRLVPTIPVMDGLALQSPLCRFILRGNEVALQRGSAAFAVDLSGPPLRGIAANARAGLWLGPDERLLLGPEAQESAIAAALAAALADTPHSLVCVSHRQCALEVLGNRAITLLNSGCPRDLDIAAFPVGACARTVFAKAEIVLWRVAPERFHVEIWRSFLDYVVGLLAEAARDG
jgi:sarcosine oxidase, subunit gamma